MKKKYLLPLLFLAYSPLNTTLAANHNVTINFTLSNLSLAEVDQFNTYMSYTDTMNPQTLLPDCTGPAPGSMSPYAVTCSNVPIDQFPVYFKVAPVVAGTEVASDKQQVTDPNPPPPVISVVQDFKIVSPAASSPPGEPPAGTVFYWGMETLPSSTTTSDVGNITISKHLNAATSTPGVTGNGLEQTDVWQTYKFPMTTLPTTKGTYQFWVKHDISSAANDPQTRYFFRSTNTERANTIYAWQNNSTTWFYVVDSAGVNHRVFNQSDSWQTGVWYQYEFTWDAASGYIAVKRNGTVIAEKTEDPWDQNTPNWGTQDMFIGYSSPIGMFDEFTISQ